MEISFKAQYIKATPIKNLKRDLSYSVKEASFVVLEPQNQADICAMRSINLSWDSGFLRSIYNNLSRYNDKFKIFALTTQKQNFEELNANKILGVALVERKPDGVLYLDYLQTNPKYIREKVLFPKYKNIGTAMLNCIKQMPNIKCIKAVSVPTAFDFYLKNDFKPEHNLLDDFSIIWRKNCKKSSL